MNLPRDENTQCNILPIIQKFLLGNLGISVFQIIFLTTLFYLLASSGDQYKPIQWFSAMSPTAGTSGNTFGQAVQDAVG